MNSLNTLINSNDRSKEWAKQCVDAAISETDTAYHYRKRDKLCYDLFNGEASTNQFDYLTGEGDMKYPAAVRFIPIMRPLFEVLRSTEASRPIKPRVFTTDNMSLEKKQKAMSSAVVNNVAKKLQAQQYRIDLMRSNAQAQIQQLQQAQPASEAQAIQLQQAMFQLQQLEQDGARYSEVLEREMKRADQYYKYRHQTREEKAMALALDYWVTKYNVDDLFMSGFDDLFIVDNEIYYIPDVQKGMDPKLRKCHPMDVYYPAEMGVTYLDELSWVCEKEYMTVTQLIQEFPDLKIDELTSLGLADEYMSAHGGYGGYLTYANESFTGPTSSGDANDGIYAGSSPVGGTVPVYRVCWRVWRQLTKAELVDAGVLSDLVTDMSDEELEEAGVKKSGTPDHWMVSDVWEGVRIGQKVYRKLRKRPMQFRDRQNVGFSYLPYIGYAYNGVDKKPYSMVWAVRDIQLLYNLVYYQQELLIALAGVKGFLMDMSQLPDGMELKEWLYYLKQGVGLIQSVSKDGRPFNYNQFSTFDQSISDGVMKLNEVLARLEYMMGRTLGVPPQRMGEVAPSALNGATQQAVANSTLTTEMLFYRHRKIRSRVMNRIISVAERAWEDGKRGMYVAGDLGQEMFSLSPEDLQNSSFEVFYNDGGRDERIRNVMEQAIMQQYGTGAVTISQMSAVLSASSINEITDLLQSFEKEAAERQSAAQEHQVAAQQQIEQMKAQVQMQLNSSLSASEKIQAEISQQQMQLDAMMARMEMEAKRREVDTGDKTERYKVDTERDTEMAYLQYERERDSVDAKLRMLELQLGNGKETSDSLPNATKQRVKD